MIDRDKLLEAYASGKPTKEIARAFGCSSAYPALLAKRAGVALRVAQDRRDAIAATLAPPPAQETESKPRARGERMGDAERARAAAESARARGDWLRELAAVPRWVPKDLREDYVANARLYGEEKAASIARAQKREAGGES